MTSEVFVRFYTEVADRSPVPVLLYNVTMYTGVNLLPDAVATLSHHPNIVGIHSNSKWARGLGRRLGWIEAHPSVVEAVERGRRHVRIPKRAMAFRQRLRKRKRMAEMRVPECAIPIQNTKLPM